MRGMFTYMADAAVFVDCETGARLPVAMQADYLALERAYLRDREEPGRPLLVTFDGTVSNSPATEGGGVEAAIFVDRFDDSWPGEVCEKAQPGVPLRNTYWKLMQVDGRSVEITADQREPHIILDLREMSFKGYGGCNHLVGSFEIEGDTLRFGPIAGTKRYCVETMDLERAVIAMLGTVTNYRISDEDLYLISDGTLVALLEARYFD